MKKQNFRVFGMTCSGCEATVVAAALQIEGLSKAVANHQEDLLTIWTQTPVSATALEAKLPKKYALTTDAVQEPSKLKQLFPLFLIFGFIIDATVLIHWSEWNTTAMMHDFMGMFFMVFSFFKLLDLKGFQTSFKIYDPMAAVWPAYGLIYPFLELALGVCYIRDFVTDGVLWISIIVLGITTAGIVKTLLKKRSIQCVCLGSVLNLPMTEATFIENAIMIVMAICLLG
jgi:cation transport ATPase